MPQESGPGHPQPAQLTFPASQASLQVPGCGVPNPCIPPSPQHPWERGKTQLPWEINLLSEMHLPWEVHLVWEMHLPWEMHLCLPLEPPSWGRGAANPSHTFLLPRLLARLVPFGSSQC